MKRYHLFIVALFLASFGVGLFLYKALVMGFPLAPRAISDIWNIECRIAFIARNAPVKVSLFVPRTSSRFAIMNENFISQGYGIGTAIKDGNRQAVWSIRKAQGQQTLYYRAVVRRIDAETPSVTVAPSEGEKPTFEGAYLAAAEALIADIHAQSADVDTFVKELIKRLNSPQPDNNTALLLGEQTAISKKVKIAVQILGHAGIAARAIQGMRLEWENREAPLIQWFQVYEEKLCRPYDQII
ncbi:MAG: UUP1 family membrane protein [Deltaproteobacteria bacterium]|nr:MAG: UUP1 family membrane protein [Deltaproteobacteria bacterium]